MALTKWRTEDPVAYSGLPASRVVATCCPSGAPRDGLRLFWPPDPLTRLMMDADGVTEAYLGDLLLKVAGAHD
jgi:hypothetical protein